jgi:hypothetical protein
MVLGGGYGVTGCCGRVGLVKVGWEGENTPAISARASSACHSTGRGRATGDFHRYFARNVTNITDNDRSTRILSEQVLGPRFSGSACPAVGKHTRVSGETGEVGPMNGQISVGELWYPGSAALNILSLSTRALRGRSPATDRAFHFLLIPPPAPSAFCARVRQRFG